jgi:hypothetical protein
MKYIFILAMFSVFSADTKALIINANANIDHNNQIVIDYSFEADVIDIDFFTLFFNADIFDNLAVTGNPDSAKWDVVATQSEDFFGTLDDGFVDFEAMISSLAVGGMISGFQITADIIDTSDIAQLLNDGFNQNFAVFDLDTFDELESGTANIAVSQQNVSAPATLGLFSLAIFAIAGTRVRSNKKSA